MITPAYALTATERVLPRLALDFTTASLDPRVTLTRALDTATRVGSNGLIATVNANLPRFDFNPITKVCRGLLIEESRVQTARATEALSIWSKSATTGVSNVVVSPTGLVDADLIYPSSSGNGRQVYLVSSAAPASGTVAISVFAEPAGKNWLIIYNLDSVTPVAWFNVATGTVGATAVGWTASIEQHENGFYRCIAVGTAAAGKYVTYGISDADNSVAVTANGTDGLYMWGSQVEAGAFATSYIPNLSNTDGSSVTRNADGASMTGTNFSSWYNASEGTFSFEGSIFVDQGATTVDFIQVSNGVSNSISIDLAMFGANAPVFQVSNSGTQCSIDTGTLTVNTVFKMVGAYKENAFVAAMNGQSPGVDNSGTIPSGLVQMGIGNRLSGPLMNGHARKIAYWPQRLINAETQAFSKG